jgi:hypothetical protein
VGGRLHTPTALPPGKEAPVRSWHKVYKNEGIMVTSYHSSVCLYSSKLAD